MQTEEKLKRGAKIKGKTIFALTFHYWGEDFYHGSVGRMGVGAACGGMNAISNGPLLVINKK